MPHSDWLPHNGGPKPFDDSVPFRVRIRCVDRKHAQRGAFGTDKWRWQYDPRNPMPGDIVEFQTERLT